MIDQENHGETIAPRLKLAEELKPLPDYYLADASASRVQLSLELSKGWIYFPIISSRRAGSEGMTAKEGYTCYFLTGNTSSDVLV
jgi:hypothetical protein